MDTQNVRAHVIVTGRVQGVAFRADARWAAERAGVTGWVRNRPDGSVEAMVEGGRAAVAQMLAWFRKGSALARVDEVASNWEPYTGEFTEFRIVR
jgi:acylphosphatase